MLGRAPRGARHRAPCPASAPTRSSRPTASANALCARGPPNGTSSSGSALPASTSPWVTAPIETSATTGSPSLEGIAIASGLVPGERGTAVRVAQAPWGRCRQERHVPAHCASRAPSSRARRSGSTTTRRRDGPPRSARRRGRRRSPRASDSRAHPRRPSGRGRLWTPSSRVAPRGRSTAPPAREFVRSRVRACRAARHRRNGRTTPARRAPAGRGPRDARVPPPASCARAYRSPLRADLHAFYAPPAGCKHLLPTLRGRNIRPGGFTTMRRTLVFALAAVTALSLASVAVATLRSAGISATTATFQAAKTRTDTRTCTGDGDTYQISNGWYVGTVDFASPNDDRRAGRAARQLRPQPDRRYRLGRTAGSASRTTSTTRTPVMRTAISGARSTAPASSTASSRAASTGASHCSSAG